MHKKKHGVNARRLGICIISRRRKMVGEWGLEPQTR